MRSRVDLDVRGCTTDTDPAESTRPGGCVYGCVCVHEGMGPPGRLGVAGEEGSGHEHGGEDLEHVRHGEGEGHRARLARGEGVPPKAAKEHCLCVREGGACTFCKKVWM